MKWKFWLDDRKEPKTYVRDVETARAEATLEHAEWLREENERELLRIAAEDEEWEEILYLDGAGRSASSTDAHLTYANRYKDIPWESESPKDIPCYATTAAGGDSLLRACSLPVGHEGPHQRSDGKEWKDPSRPKPIIVYGDYVVTEPDQLANFMDQMDAEIFAIQQRKRKLSRAVHRIHNLWGDKDRIDG